VYKGYYKRIFMVVCEMFVNLFKALIGIYRAECPLCGTEMRESYKETAIDTWYGGHVRRAKYCPQCGYREPKSYL
jgi:C4-type Zn-finger protein